MSKENERRINENFGKMVKYLRERQGLSLYDLSKLTESRISPSYLSRIENADRKCPTIPIVKEIGNALNIDFVHLLELSYDEMCSKQEIPSLQEILITEEYSINGIEIERNIKEKIVRVVDSILDAQWTDETMLKDIFIINQKISDLKEEMSK